MRFAWTINTIPASQQQKQAAPPRPQPPAQQQPPANLQHYFTPNQKASLPPKLPDEYAANEFSVKRIFWPSAGTSYFSSKTNPNSESIQPAHHPSQIVS